MPPSAPGRKRRLTPKQKAVLAFVTANPDATLNEIGLACGLSPAFPAGGAAAVMRSENVQQRMLKIMDSMPSLQDQALLEKLKEGLDSKRTDHAINQRTGELHEFTADDMPTRKQYLDLACRLKGALASRTEISGPDGGPIPITSAPIAALASLTKEQLEAVAKATK